MKQEEAIEKGINIKKLEKEQEKLGKNLNLKDSIDFSLANRIAGISTIFSEKKAFSGIVVLNQDLEIIEQQYSIDKIPFPYISGFRAYRELPTMIDAIQKLEEKPDLIFVSGHGVLHPRLGLASHLSLVTNIPCIGVAKSLVIGEEKGNKILIKKKHLGEKIQIKPSSKPSYLSPGNLITLKTSLEIMKKFSNGNHKLPEPLHLSHRYITKTMNEYKTT